MSKNKKSYFFDPFVILVVSISGSIVLSIGLTRNVPVLFDWDVESVNYWLEVINNIGMGFFVSAIFYWINIAIPTNKSKAMEKRIINGIAQKIRIYNSSIVMSLMDCEDKNNINCFTTKDFKVKFEEFDKTILHDKENRIDLIRGVCSMFKNINKQFDELLKYEGKYLPITLFESIRNHVTINFLNLEYLYEEKFGEDLKDFTIKEYINSELKLSDIYTAVHWQIESIDNMLGKIDEFTKIY